LWDQKPSLKTDCLISAIEVYKSSAKHAAVTQAVDEAFKEDEGHLFEDAKGSDDPSKSAFAERLVQIALNNCLCMSYLAETYISYSCLSSSTEIHLVEKHHRTPLAAA
jgi:hypothetical protein